MVEQLTFNQLVRGSSPRPATSNKTLAQTVSCFIRLKKALRNALILFPLIGRIAQW